MTVRTRRSTTVGGGAEKNKNNSQKKNAQEITLNSSTAAPPPTRSFCRRLCNRHLHFYPHDRQGHAAGGDAALEAQGRAAGQLPGAGRLQPGAGRAGDARTFARVHVRAEDAAGQTEPEPGAERVQHPDGAGRRQGGPLPGRPVVQHLGQDQGVPGRPAAQPGPGRLQRRVRGQRQAQVARVHGERPVQHAGRPFAQARPRRVFARKGQ